MQRPVSPADEAGTEGGKDEFDEVQLRDLREVLGNLVVVAHGRGLDPGDHIDAEGGRVLHRYAQACRHSDRAQGEDDGGVLRHIFERAAAIEGQRCPAGGVGDGLRCDFRDDPPRVQGVTVHPANDELRLRGCFDIIGEGKAAAEAEVVPGELIRVGVDCLQDVDGRVARIDSELKLWVHQCLRLEQRRRLDASAVRRGHPAHAEGQRDGEAVETIAEAARNGAVVDGHAAHCIEHRVENLPGVRAGCRRHRLHPGVVGRLIRIVAHPRVAARLRACPRVAGPGEEQVREHRFRVEPRL